MRYESRAYGTREEIIRTLRDRMGSSGSPRRNEESAQAIFELENGATAVVTRGHYYVVTGEPIPYLVELAADDREEVSYERVAARSNTEAWQMAHDLANALSQRVVKLYRDVTEDET